MKLLNYVLLLWIFIGSACMSSKTVELQSDPVDCKWGFPWIYSDSTGVRAKMVSTSRNCFPGFDEYENEFEKVAIKIYDRQGEIQYTSTVISENWVCNIGQNSNFEEGVYIYVFMTETAENPSQKDTTAGQIILYR